MYLHPNPVKENMKVMKPISLTLVMSVFVGLLGMWIGGCETQEQKVERLIGELQDQEWSVPSNVAYALGSIRSKDAVPALIQALQDQDVRVRGNRQRH